MAKRARQRSAEQEGKPEGPIPKKTIDRTAEVAPIPAEPRLPPAEAISLFEKGMSALQRHAYAEAADRFHALVDSFPAEGALRERSQVYLALCDREMKRQSPAPRTVEERLTAATAALNDDDDAAAERLARSVLADVPEHDLALYLLAAVEARRGSTDGALTLLEHAIAISPEIRAQARHDADFEDLRELEAFRQLIEVPNNHGAPGQRRFRRGRSER